MFLTGDFFICAIAWYDRFERRTIDVILNLTRIFQTYQNRGVIAMKLVKAPHDIDGKNKHALRLIKEETFDCIHMHLKQGENISTHHAKTDVLIIVRSGKVEFDVEGEKVVLTNEDVLHLKPYEKHGLKAIEETDIILIKIH